MATEPRAGDEGTDVRRAALALLEYCRAEGWAGHDPYDALNSRVFSTLPWLDRRLPRLVLTQALKRSPIDVRGLARVPKTQNPKALALFLASVLELEAAGAALPRATSAYLLQRLIALRSPGVRRWCWGYSFPWQTRTDVVPRWTPNVVCTSFVAGALLDLHSRGRDVRCLEMAADAAQYLLEELYWTDGRSAAGFGYPLRSSTTLIHNANLLAASLLARLHAVTGERAFLEPAIRVARHAAAHQRADGSWPYGEAPHQRWIDNFHTGYNLCALRAIGQHAGTAEFEPALAKGFAFYADHFVAAPGIARYFHDRTYPIDVHAVAQSIITLLAFEDLRPGSARLAFGVFRWAMGHMWDARGYFYYRVHRVATVRTSYMRWSQAWMLRALASLSQAAAAQQRRSAPAGLTA